MKYAEDRDDWIDVLKSVGADVGKKVKEQAITKGDGTIVYKNEDGRVVRGNLLTGEETIIM